MSNQNISWEQIASGASKFFYETTDDNGDKTRRMGILRKAVIVISFPCRDGTTDKVAFMKTNRSQNYRDSRDLKRRLTQSELLAELVRWLGENAAERALNALSV